MPAATALILWAFSFTIVTTSRGARLVRRENDEFTSFILATSGGVVALCATVFLFSDLPAYGSWSLPVPVLFVSLTFLSLSRGRKASKRRLAVLVGAQLSLGFVVFLFLQRQVGYHERYRLFYLNRDAVVAFFRGASPKLIEYDDGIIGFATHFQTLSAFDLASDKELHEAIRQNGLLSIAKRRGYDRIASLAYLPPSESGATALDYLSSVYRSDASARVTYRLEYFDPSLPFAVARITNEAR